MTGVLDGAAATGARVVYADNLYAYGPVAGPLTEDLPYRATGRNGRVRAVLAGEVMTAHETGRVRATIGRASDYYGPAGRQSTAGERLFVPALAGKPVQVLGDPDQPHTFTYLADFARALVTLGTDERAFGEIWHVPSAETLTTRQFVTLVYEVAGYPARLRVLPPALLAGLALVSPMLRAVREQQYQRARAVGRRPFEVRAGFWRTRNAPPRRDPRHPQLVRDDLVTLVASNREPLDRARPSRSVHPATSPRRGRPRAERHRS